MVSVKHIQYPVGQGGLHLGIIKNYAYIYDCGGYGKCVDWDNIFDDVVKKLKIANCQNLDIFISHWHQDHCNKLEKLEGYLDKAKIKYVEYFPEITRTVKILLVCEHLCMIEDGMNDKDIMPPQNYIKLIFDKHKSVQQISDNRFRDIRLADTEYILKPYVTRIPSKYLRDFEMALSNKKIDIPKDEILTEYPNNFWSKVVEIYKMMLKNSKLTKLRNRLMLSLYCGKSNINRFRNENNCWLHTGDAYMKKKDLSGFINRFGGLLYNVNFAQIPHHGSKNNHDDTFSLLFNSCNCHTFYYTVKIKNCVKTDTADISLCLCPCQMIREISENPLTKLEV